ncbi:MAG: ABC transporter ATP-binding protein [Conexivisphaerales archaeon]
MNALELNDVNVYYKTPLGKVHILHSINVNFEKGHSIGIVGESGSGKSTLGHAIVNLLPPNGILNGQILFNGNNLVSLRRSQMTKVRGTGIFMIMQDPFSSLDPVKKVGRQLIEALKVKYERLNESLDEQKAYLEINKRLRDVKFPDPENVIERYPYQLSGGQIQRIVIAMGLLLEPTVLIADEPTSALDVSIQAQIMTLLAELQRSYNMTLLFITHDLSVAYTVSDMITILYAGRIMEYGATDDVILNPMHPYTEGLLKSFPKGRYVDGPLYTLKGAPPTFFDLPSGCKFNPRCPYVFSRCYEEEPQLYLQKDGRKVRCFLHE